MLSEQRRPRSPVWTRSILWLMLVLLYGPLAVMVLGAFRFQGAWGFGHFVQAISDPYWMEALGRSAAVAVGTGLLSTILGMGAALSLEKRRSFTLGTRSLLIFITLAMVMPELVFALTLLSWFAWLGQSLSLLTVIAAHVTFSVSFSFLIFQGQLAQMDDSLLEAAQDLGASPWQAFWKVKLPLLIPSVFSSFLVCFILSFDDFLISYYVNGVGSDTLPIKLYSSMKTGMTPQLNALATLMSLISAGVLILIARFNLRQNKPGK